MTDRERLQECLNCKVHKLCNLNINEPEDNEDGSCKTKKLLMNRQEDKNNE